LYLFCFYILATEKNNWSVSSAPFGSAGIIPISYLNMKMLAKDLLKATQYAILNANYILARLKDDYPILYRDPKGFCAHEFIIDIRKIKV
jgi:glycine dehydrogenase